MIDNTEYVKLYRSLDLNILPCDAENKRPLADWTQYQTKKYDGVIKSTDELCLITGSSSDGVVVIDLDDRSLATDVFTDFEGLKKVTLVVESGKGYHIYARSINFPPPNMRIKDQKGRRIDIQANNTIAVLPPSIHHSGKQYQIISEAREIVRIDFAILFDHLKEKGFNVDKKRFKLQDIKNGVGEGERNDTCFNFVMFLRREYHLDKNTVSFWIREWNKNNTPPLREAEIQTIVDSAFSYDQVYNQKKRNYDEDRTNFSLCGTRAFAQLVSNVAIEEGVGLEDVNVFCKDCNQEFKFKRNKEHHRHYVKVI